ncbi:MAG: flagellar FlbD family protein [Candidatus Methylomirabilia bacterium]
MVTLTAVNGARFSVRAELVQSIKDQPATTVVLATGLTLVVRETPATVRELVKTARELEGRRDGGTTQGQKRTDRHPTS